MFKRRVFSLFILFFIGSSFAVFGQSRMIYVDKTIGKDTSVAGTRALPFAKIQTGIDSARNGDTVFVARGIYVENVDLKSKSLVLISNYFYSNDTTDIVNTKIDGNLNGSYGLTVNGASYVNGFNVVNSYPGGIYITTTGSRLDNIIAEYNQGTGITVGGPQNTRADLLNIITRYNQGAGFLEFLQIVKVTNIKSYFNSSYGMHLQSGIDTISNALVYGNTGGLWVWNSNSTLSHFTVTQNRGDGFWSHANGFLKIYNSIVWANDRSGNISDARALVYNSVIENGSSGINRNIETFLTYDSSNNSRNPNFIDTASRNFQIGNYSSALGIGVQESFFPVVDILGNVRPNPSGSAPDAGAYENMYKHQPALINSAEGGNQLVRLRWSQAPGSRLARYKVFRSTSPIADNATGGVVTDTLGIGRFEFVDATGLTNLTKYYYRMKTIDSAGIESGMSNEITVIPNVQPAVPDSFFVEAGPYSAFLKWKGSLNQNTKYSIYRSSNGGVVEKIADTVNLQTFVDSNLTIGAEYAYAIASVDQYGVRSDTSSFIKIRPNRIFYVSPNGDNKNSGSTNSPKQSITLASNLARIGDTIILKRGVYNEIINLTGKVKLVSSMHIFTNDSTDILQTRLSGLKNGNSNLISLNSNLENDVFVNAVTIEDVRLQVVYLGYPSVYSFRLQNSIIDNCGTYGQWGVIALGSNGVLENSIVKRSKGRYVISVGGGEVRNCYFYENSTSPLGNIYDDASIIHIEGGSKAKVSNNVLYRNLANAIDFGGNGGDSMFIVNNTVALNSGYGIKFQTWGGVYTGVLVNNISKFNKLNDIYANVVTNGPGVYLKNNFFGLAGQLSSTNLLSPNNTLLDTLGNIGGDPFFVDTLNNDFRLRPYSTAIGRGFVTPFLLTKDILGRPRINTQRSTPDMGAFESEFKHASPLIVSAEGGNGTALLKWTQSPGSRLARYKVFRSTSPIADNATGGVVTDTIGVTSKEYVDGTGLTNLTRYYYRMKTIDSAGVESGMSNEVSVIPNVLSAKVSDFRVSGSSRVVGVRWTSRSGFKYNVYRGTDKSVLNLIAKEVADSSYQDSIVIKNQRYYYNVRSVDSVGVPGVASDTLEVQTTGYFYVSPEGSDLDGGSSSSPFKTIRRALQLAQSTDTIILKSGVHQERLNIRHTQRPLTIASEYLLSGDTSVISKTILDASTVQASPLIYDSTAVYGNANNLYNQMIGFTITKTRGAVLDGPNRWNVRKMVFTANNANAYLLQSVNRLNVDSSFFFGNGNENSATGLVYVRDSGSLRNSVIRDNQLEGHAFVSDGGNVGDSVVVSGNLFTRTRYRNSAAHQAIINTNNTYNFVLRDNILASNDRNAFIYIYMADRTDCKAYVYNNTIVNNNTQWDAYASILISSRIQSEVNIYNNIVQNNKSNNTRLQVAINPEGSQPTVGKIHILNNVIGSDSATAVINNLNLLDVRRNSGNTFNAVSIVDSARGDYRLQNWSWGLGMGYAGTDLPRSPRDFAGTVRSNPSGSLPDLGAFENPLSVSTAYLDNIQRSGDSVFIPWNFNDRASIDSVIILRSTNQNVESNNSVRRAIIVSANQLVIKDTLSSSLVHYYAIIVKLKNGTNTALSNVRASNALAKKASFLPQMVNPRFAWGDIDADGDLDLAVMGETPGIFFQLYRNANGTFTEVFDRTKTPQLFKGAMKFADIDNDGDIDLVASGQRTTAINNLATFLFRNDGTGNFTFNEVIDIVSTREGEMAFGDHDNDGDLDMALSGIDVNGLSRLTVYNNNGKGTFSIERRLFPSQGGPSDPLYSDLLWVDYDNDGDQDLIFSGRASGSSAGIVTNTLFNSNQTNNFTGSNIRYYNEWALRNAALEAADINADGWVDIVASGSVETGTALNRQTRIIYGSPNGFQTTSWLLLDNIAGQVRVADYDNDGDLDILVSGTDQQANPRTVFYLNTGSGLGFDKKTYEIIPNLDRSAFSWADYDNDGDLDLVISGQKPSSQGGQVISEIYTFEPDSKNLAPAKPAMPTIQNFGDGRILVTWNPGSDDLTLPSSLNYLLKIGTVSLTGIPAESYTVVEANKNGGTLLNPETSVIYSTQYFTQLNPGRYYFILQVVDPNKLTSLPSDTLFLTLTYPWKFVNQGGIADATILPNTRLSAKWGDIDRDNDYDFLYGSNIYESNRINYAQSDYQFDDGALFNSTLANSGGQAFVKPNIKWHDISQDGIPDLIVSSTELINPSNATWAKFRLNIYKNDPRLSETGRGRLSRLSLGAEDSIYLGSSRFKITDLNNDGKPDILLAGVDKATQSKVHVFTTGPLSTDKTSPPGFKFSRLSTNLDSLLIAQNSYDLVFDFGDVDGDSDNDFVAFYKNELGDLLAKTYLNTGISLATGKIAFIESSGFLFDPLDRASIDLIDYDKDGDLDLLTSGRSFLSGQQFNIYESINGTFIKIANPIQPFENAKLSFGDINNDGFSDLIYTGTREGTGLISKIAVYNPSTKGFQEQSQFLFGQEFSDLNIEFGDFDADSDLDILVNGVLSGTNPSDLFRVYKNVQNESSKVLKALGVTSNSSSLLTSQGNLSSEGSSERSFLTSLNEAVPTNTFTENNIPTTPTNLKEQIISRVGDVFTVRFSWDAASDDNTPVEGLSYELRVGTASGKSDEVVSLSLENGYRMVPEEGNTGRKRVWDINLKPGTYYWSAQSVDASYAGSAFAPERQFTLDASGQICDASAPIITYSGSLSICQGNVIVLKADKKQNIEWYLNGNIIANAVDSILSVSSTGEYKARFNNPGCISSFSPPLMVTVSPKPIAGNITAPSTSICAGQNLVLTASSDSAYQWYRNDVLFSAVGVKSISVNESGTYYYIAKSNGCLSDKSASVTITVNAKPTSTFTMSSSSICEGSKVTLTASTGSGYTYQWLKNGVNIAGATSSTYSAGETGRYSVLVSNNGCSALSGSDTLTVTAVPAKPSINKDGTELVSSSATGNVWYQDGSLIQGATQQRYKPTANGNYSAKVRNNGCESVMSETFYFLVTALVDLGNDQYIKAYPNPLTNGQDLIIDWRLSGLNETIRAEVFDIKGRRVLDKKMTRNNNRLKIDGVNGMYFVQLTWSNNQRYTIRVMKN